MKKTLMLAAALACVPAGVMADSAGWAGASETQIKNGRMLVDISEIGLEGKPNCANDNRWEFVVTDPGQQQLIKEMALRGGSLYWQGSGQCDGSAETVKSVYTCFMC